MSKQCRLGRAHLGREALDMGEHDLLVAQRDVAELLLVLVVFGDRIDEGAAVEAIPAESGLEGGEDAHQLRLGVAAAGFDGADEPFAPLLAFALQHGRNEVGLRAE